MLRSAAATTSNSLLETTVLSSNGFAVSHTKIAPPRKHSSHHWKKPQDKKEYLDKFTTKNRGKNSYAVDKTSTTNVEGLSTSTYPSSPIYAPADSVLNEYLSVACDATGQYVAILTDNTSPALYMSNNYGVTYDMAFSPPFYYNYDTDFGAVAIASNAPNYIAFGGYNGIFVSNNTGASFTLVPSTANIYNWYGLAMSSTGQYVYATAGGGEYYTQGYLYASTDFGNTFAKLSNAPANGYLSMATSANGQYVFAITQSNVYSSSDYGSSFAIAFTLGYIEAIGCSSTAQYVGIGTETGSIYISSNYGKSWTKASLSIPYGPSWTGISFSSNGQKVLAVGEDAAVFISTNYGSSFSMSTSPASQFAFGAVSSSGQYMYAVSQQGYPYASTDSGNTWSPLYYQWYGVASSQNGQYRFAISIEDQPAVYMSSDNGIKWSSVTSIFSAVKYLDPWSVSCNSDCQYVAVTTFNNQVVVSTNYGKSWNAVTLIATGVTNVDDDYNDFVVTSVAISSNGQYMTAVTNTGPIFYSSNYGGSFTQATATPTIQNYWTVAMSSNGQYQLAGTVEYSFFTDYLPNENSVYLSSDFGKSWTVISNLPAGQFWNAVSMDSTGTYMVAAQGYGGNVYYSTDSGASWTQSQFVDGTDNFAGLCQSSNGQIVYVADGSATELIAAGNIYMSTDFGATFQVTGSPLAEWSQLACDSTGQYVTATADAGQVYTTSNSGMTWIPQNITVVSPLVSPTSDSSSSSDSLSGGAVAGIVIGTLVGVSLIGVAVAVFVFGVALPCFASKGTPLLSNKA